jgi:ABC-type sugar transport system permease subunit
MPSGSEDSVSREDKDMYAFSRRWIILLLLLPTLVFFTVYTLYPVASTFRTAFQYNRINTPKHYATMDNWKLMLKDAHLPNAFKNSLIIMACEFVLLFPLSFLLGMLLNINFRGGGVVKVITFLPYILSGVLTTLIWYFIVDPGMGILNPFLRSIGLGKLAAVWIGGPKLTPYTISVIDSWKAIGFYAVLIMAGLKMIPRELNEAATIDGVSRAQRSWYITFPLLRETLKIAVVYIIISALQTFQTVVILTRGGPNYKSTVLAYYIYDEQWGFDRNFGYGAAISLILFVIIMGLSIGFLTLTRKRVEN